MHICTRCAEHLPETAMACPRCGQPPAAPPRERGAAVGTEPPGAGSPDNDGVQIPPRLAWRLRLLDVRSYPSPKTVKAVFLVAASASAAAGVVALILGVASGAPVGPGCMLVIEAPLIGVFCIIGFIISAAMWQLLSHTIIYIVDPKRRKAVDALQRIQDGAGDNEPPNDPQPRAAAPDGVTTPGTPPDERVTQGPSAEVKQKRDES